MKKFLAVLMTLTMVAGVFAGCGSTTKNDAAVKTGVGVVANAANSTSAEADAEGAAKYNASVAAVAIDADGKIVSLKVDAFNPSIAFDATGAITTDMTAAVKSKIDLKEEYGMKGVSPIGKEWYEQAAAIEKFAVGKTADELLGALDADGYASDADLSAGATIILSDIFAAVKAACDNAKDCGAKADDALALGVIPSYSAYHSKDASADGDGLAELDTDIVAITVKDDVITSCVVDCLQQKVSFDTAGVITSDAAAASITKMNLKEEYGMKGVSPIGKEWYEQAEALNKFATGKKVADVAAAIGEDGYASDADLSAGATMDLSGSLAAMQNAASKVK